MARAGEGAGALHQGRYYVGVRRGAAEEKRDLAVTLEKLFPQDSLRIVLSDDEDPTFLCSLHVTRADYEELKKQQGLLIDFDNFPAQLVRLLQQCAANNMFLILQQNNPLQYFFEVVEHNEFRRLVHLSLKTGPATDADIKAHMADTIMHLKKSLLSLKNISSSNETIWNDKLMSMERKIHDLTISLNKMEEDKLRRETEHQELLNRERDRFTQERLEWQMNAEATSKTHASSFQETIARKDKQYDELNSKFRHLKDNAASLEGQLNDKSQRMQLLEKEVQKAHIEVATLKAKNTTLERDGMEKERHIHQSQTKMSDLEKSLREYSENVKQLTSTVQCVQREKASLEQKLSLSESLVNKNHQAVQAASEQLLKANQIIAKQNSDLAELKEKLLCRTQIALEQEKVIERNILEMDQLKSEASEAKTTCDKLRVELDALTQKMESQEKSVKEKDETIKNNNLVIQYLHKKLEDNSSPTNGFRREQTSRRPENTCASSTPYFNTTDSIQDISENTPDFYATCRGPSNESPRTEVFSKTGKTGLDPRYLRPAGDDKTHDAPSTEKSKNSDGAQTKGKENKLANLPRVDYNEKKTGRSVSYRATPVSAYFPYKP